MKKLAILPVLCILSVICVVSTLKYVSAQSGNESLTKLTRSVPVGDNFNNSVTLNVSGMMENDAVNITVGDPGVILAKVATIADRNVTFPGGSDSIVVPLPGGDVPENSLTMSQSSITFNRPAIGGKVLLYIQIPEAVKVTISQNNSLVVEEYLVTSPLKVKNGTFAKGQSTISKSVLALMYPTSETDTEEIKQVGEGQYFVPFEKLEVLNQQNQFAGLTFTANVDIDETGVVTTVKVLTPLNSPQVQNALMSLRFKPFSFKGNTVKVSTVIKQ